MSDSEPDEFYYDIQDETIKEAFDELPFMTEVFRNPLYDIKKSVDSDIDFLLGAVIQRIIGHSSLLYFTRKARTPTKEQYVKLNYRLFSRASEFREKILKIVGS